MRFIAIAFLSFAFASVAGIASGQDPAASYPSKPVRIFGQGTGSTADYLAPFSPPTISRHRENDIE